MDDELGRWTGQGVKAGVYQMDDNVDEGEKDEGSTANKREELMKLVRFWSIARKKEEIWIQHFFFFAFIFFIFASPMEMDLKDWQSKDEAKERDRDKSEMMETVRSQIG